MVKGSNLRGLGGAGFPAGVKWGFMPKSNGSPRYLCVNADEGEPGTFKDREILNRIPHMMIEGIVIAAYAMDVHQVFIYIRGEFVSEYRILERALAEAASRNVIGDHILGTEFSCNVILHRGAGAYICGEETALMDSIEGRRGNPRIKPPFPAVKGVFGRPTTINNVETLCNLPHIMNKGVDWFKSLGTERCGGNKIFSVSGHVNHPGNYDIPFGTHLRRIINDHAGGVWKERALKGVIPGGVSSAILKADEIDISMDFETLAKAGTMLGSGAIIVMDETTCMVEALHVIARFFAHESCGQCTQCRIGSRWIEQILDRILKGDGRPNDIDLLLDLASNMKGQTICVFTDALAAPVESFLAKYKHEFEDHIYHKTCKESGGCHRGY